jgi:hypothetical protein
VLSLPIFPALTITEQRAVVDTIDRFFARQIRAPHGTNQSSLGIGHAIEMVGGTDQQGIASRGE